MMILLEAKMTIAVILLVMLFFILAAALYLGFLTISRKLYVKIFKRPHPMPQVDRSPSSIDQSTIFGRGQNWFYSNRMEFLNVRIDSFDKVRLSGYFRPSADRSSRFAVILLHAYDEHPSQMSAYARLMMRQIQCHVLIAHGRAHCMSGGKTCTHGLYESVDLTRWIDYIKMQVGNDCRIFIVGRGLGASSALLAAQQKDFSENVAGIIADSPYEVLEPVLLNRLKAIYKFDCSPFMGSVRHIAIKRKGLDLRLCDTAIHADRIRVPVLIFQGGEDEITRPSGSKRIFDNIRAPKRLVQIDRADHLMGYDISPSTYEREVRHFIEQCVVRLVSIGRM
ncbi:MAG: hypothetical protein II167_03235 [Clostridiales bacterium]|nr:hypothetical protein [Clostridiales bacterium]